MFTSIELPVNPVQSAQLLTLPINVMLAVPDYIGNNSSAPVYNLIAGINTFLGSSSEWSRRTKVLRPGIWAPSWSDADLLKFIQPSFVAINQIAPPNLVTQLRITQLPPQREGKYEQYEVVHFIGYVTTGEGNDHVLHLGSVAPQSEIRAGSLRDIFVEFGTQLFILQVPIDQFSSAARLGETIAGAGGPAVLVVVGDSNVESDQPAPLGIDLLMLLGSSNWVRDDAATADLHTFLSQVYLNVVHSYSLPDLALFPDWVTKPTAYTARLFYGQGGEGSLQVLPWIDDLENRMLRAQTVITDQRKRLDRMKRLLSKRLHTSQIEAVRPLVYAKQAQVVHLKELIDEQQTRLSSIRVDIHNHETRGAMPLTEVGDRLVPIEAVIEAELGPAKSIEPDLSPAPPPLPTVQAVEELFDKEASKAPRVLNANFEDKDSLGGRLPPRKGIMAGATCAFLVDVGPLWDKGPSIVKGLGDFPSKSLPQDVSGWDVQVVLVSDDFEPKVSSGKIYVPQSNGRSHPYQNELYSNSPGPLSLVLKAPAFPKQSKRKTMTARARLCLYYENNLLQSAVVNVGIIRDTATELKEDNVVDVDYRLTGSFQQIERYATRSLQLDPKKEPQVLPVALNLTINDDGGAGHRLLVKEYNELVPAIMPYNPVGSVELLESARQTLKDCFYQRDENGQVQHNGQEPDGLEADNGKSLQQFKRDLFALCDLGRKLYFTAFTQVEPEKDDETSLTWKQNLRKALVNPAVVQIARTKGVPVEYVYPWGLIYLHNLEMDTNKWSFCDIIDREWKKSRRKGLFDHACPLEKIPGDHENKMCPYGFLGIRHTVEQPITPLRKKDGKYLPFDTPDEIAIGSGPINVAIGITRDQTLDAKAISTHLEELTKILALIPPGAADDHDKVKNILPHAQMVYFLCHGELDTTLVPAEPYIGVGLRDMDPLHRVYPRDLSEWALSEKLPNLAPWSQQRPLVFINGCHTSDLRPTQILNFVTILADIQAGGVIGTEISIRLPLATEVAKIIINKLSSKKPNGELFSIGEAIQFMRGELLNKGNLLGLAYTPYCLANLRFTSN